MAGEDVARFDGVTCLKAGERGILVELGDEQMWVPLKVLAADSEVKAAGDRGELAVAWAWARRVRLV